MKTIKKMNAVLDKFIDKISYKLYKGQSLALAETTW